MADQPIPQSHSELSAVFTAAADYINAHGLAKGIFAYASGACCTVGALSVAASGSALDAASDVCMDMPLVLFAALEAMAGRLPDVNEDPVEQIAQWNDAPERTAAEVVAELRAAAADALARECVLAARDANELAPEVAHRRRLAFVAGIEVTA
ncbi:hypothetical protein JJV70_15315 [Streptomyces sp. JJ66]|uniref:DUF6197 family protein n=1 Tax=Streptomyces sp. JJ66 TaxID=2803843 RepID=UPI001C5849A2|nr:hypothetical protein [Streptomyces sp. JJ66]MBW1603449.1 hypothetical protein [Streptomyces sp. JJ66]